jgi:hypothetical protein
VLRFIIYTLISTGKDSVSKFRKAARVYDRYVRRSVILIYPGHSFAIIISINHFIRDLAQTLSLTWSSLLETDEFLKGLAAAAVKKIA